MKTQRKRKWVVLVQRQRGRGVSQEFGVGALREKEAAAGGEGRGLQARERLVSISRRASWLFLWKMSFHTIVSWWQSWGFRWIETPPFRISVGRAVIRCFFPPICHLLTSLGACLPSKRGMGLLNMPQVPQGAEETPSASFSPTNTTPHVNKRRSGAE